LQQQQQQQRYHSADDQQQHHGSKQQQTYSNINTGTTTQQLHDSTAQALKVFYDSKRVPPFRGSSNRYSDHRSTQYRDLSAAAVTSECVSAPARHTHNNSSGGCEPSHTAGIARTCSAIKIDQSSKHPMAQQQQQQPLQQQLQQQQQPLQQQQYQQYLSSLQLALPAAASQRGSAQLSKQQRRSTYEKSATTKRVVPSQSNTVSSAERHSCSVRVDTALVHQSGAVCASRQHAPTSPLSSPRKAVVTTHKTQLQQTQLQQQQSQQQQSQQQQLQERQLQCCSPASSFTLSPKQAVSPRFTAVPAVVHAAAASGTHTSVHSRWKHLPPELQEIKERWFGMSSDSLDMGQTQSKMTANHLHGASTTAQVSNALIDLC
jgi:hypothetical protein